MKAFLLEQAARCRRLAQTISDKEFAEKLLIMAEGYEVKASNVQSPTMVSRAPDMTSPTQKEIECRAYRIICNRKTLSSAPAPTHGRGYRAA